MEGQNRRGTSRAPYIAGLLMWLGFGIIVTEVINKAELIPMRLSAPHMAVFYSDCLPGLLLDHALFREAGPPLQSE
jgi:hypothetical protein